MFMRARLSADCCIIARSMISLMLMPSPMASTAKIRHRVTLMPSRRSFSTRSLLSWYASWVIKCGRKSSNIDWFADFSASSAEPLGRTEPFGHLVRVMSEWPLAVEDGAELRRIDVAAGDYADDISLAGPPGKPANVDACSRHILACRQCQGGKRHDGGSQRSMICPTPAARAFSST